MGIDLDRAQVNAELHPLVYKTFPEFEGDKTEDLKIKPGKPSSQRGLDILDGPDYV